MFPELPNDMTSNAPVIVAYTHLGEVKSVYLLAEDQIVLSDTELKSAAGVISVLLGCYYLFNRGYPPVSKGLFDCLETYVLGKKVSKGSKSFNAFRKLYTNKKSPPIAA